MEQQRDIVDDEYDHKNIEPKWQDYWDTHESYKAKDNDPRQKYYCLIEFPYPSGDGLHVGHVRSNTAMDIIARKRRGEGYNVLYPIGYDSFGLPTENYAIKTGIQPQIVTKNNTATFTKQLRSLGYSFDWSRKIDTSDPSYYKWTQWIFIQMFKKGLAYKKKTNINWCPSCKTGLAKEEVINGTCERCGGVVEKREKEQWMLAITTYADRLDKDLDDTEYIEKIKIQQRNWIGKSNGTEFEFPVAHSDIRIPVFTTRPDTLFGVTYLVLAPENTLVEDLRAHIQNWEEVDTYRQETKKKTEIERTNENSPKTGIQLKGVVAVHPATQKEIPVWLADYVLDDYGTGSVMAVPAHDKRDFAFAKKYQLAVIEVISGGDPTQEPFLGDGPLINSQQFDGKENREAGEGITSAFGKEKTSYKLKDWVFSRQRYWGEPIPLINCGTCGWVPVPESDLPVELPMVTEYKPTDSGESPLAGATDWIKVKCPQCGGVGTRETDTMPNWAGSSWYYLRYMDPTNDTAFLSEQNGKYWSPVDWYNGGMEHVTLHLLYSRFWHKFLFDMGLVPTKEPYAKRTAHGMILAENGEKMSKSKGNVINPDHVVQLYGADTLRLYEMFMGPFDQQIKWDTENIIGSRRFIEKIWRLKNKVSPRQKETHGVPSIEVGMNVAIKKVSEDIEKMGFNTAISSLMIFSNLLEKEEQIDQHVYETFLRLVAPFVPHVTEELWSRLGHQTSIHLEPWPTYDSEKLRSDIYTIVIQVNSKIKGSLEFNGEPTEEQVTQEALAIEKVSRTMNGSPIKKVIYVKNKILNIII